MESKLQSPPTPPASERSHGKSQAERQNGATTDPQHEQADNSDVQLVQRKPAAHQEALERPVADDVAHDDDGRGGAPAVRLDMDLDVEVELKAKIEGDITLSVLGGDQKPTGDKGHSTKALEG